MAEGTIRVFVPTGRVGGSTSPNEVKAARGATGLVIGLLDNHKHNTDKILDHLERRLGARYRDVRFVRLMKDEAGKAAPAGMIEALAADCTAVINGIGD